MSWFVDASALVSILAKEPDWQLYADRADEEPELLWSPLSRWETIVALARQRDLSIDEARDVVVGFCAENGFLLVQIGEREAEIAVDAATRYGRRSGHAAKLNMGDCFAYACAKANQAKLLYKGNDFSHTDLAHA